MIKEPKTDPRELIAAAIRILRSEYIREGNAPSYYEINNGLCDEFAETISNRLRHHLEEGALEIVENISMLDEQTGGWDADLLAINYGGFPPEHFCCEQLDALQFGNHVWLTDGLRHYDAECPDGVKSFFDLPIFRRVLIKALRRRGIDAPDITVEDVRSAPRCRIPVQRIA